MAPKASEFEREKVLQAVIIGESFDNQFDPISRAVPKVLMPLVNTPIIDYTLEWFHRCGMQDVILYCRATPFSSQIKEHCKSLVARRQWTTMTVRVIASDSIRSMGDAMRDLYAKSLVTGDFLLMRGDTVANINIKQMMSVHRSNRDRDPKTAMTLLLMPMEPDGNPAAHSLDTESQSSRIAPDSSSRQRYSSLRVSTVTDAYGKILDYQRHRRGTAFNFPTHVMNDHDEVFINAQLPDPNMSICNADMPGLFADNFDCMTRDGLVKGLVEPDDLNCCSVYQHVVRDGFAIGIATWGDYERASLAVTQRHLSPLCPEISLTTGRHRYQHSAFDCLYRTASCNLAGGRKQGCFLDERGIRQQLARAAFQVVFGEAMEVSESAFIRSCVFGNHCRVGDKAVLDRVFVGDNCIIEAGCKVTQAYLGPNVHLLPNTVLERGCVISASVTLGPNQTLPAASLVATRDLWDTLDELEADQDPEQVSANGFLFPRDASCFVDDAGDSDSDDEFGIVAKADRSGSCAGTGGVVAGYTMSQDGQMLPIWGLTEDDLVIEEGEEGDEEEAGEDCVDAPVGEELDEDEQRELGFLHEVMDSLVMGLRENMDVAKVALEINASRYAYNISLETMQQIVFTGVLRCADEESNKLKPGSSIIDKLPWPAWPSIKKGLHRYKDVLQKYLKTDNDFLNTLERVVCSDPDVLACSVKLLYELTQELELVDDSALLLWFRKGGLKGSQPPQGFQQLKEKVADFLTWLENADEESSEEESDSEED